MWSLEGYETQKKAKYDKEVMCRAMCAKLEMGANNYKIEGTHGPGLKGRPKSLRPGAGCANREVACLLGDPDSRIKHTKSSSINWINHARIN